MIRTLVALLFLIGWAGWIAYHLILIVLGGGKALIIPEPNLTIAVLEIVIVAGTIVLGIERLVDLVKRGEICL